MFIASERHGLELQERKVKKLTRRVLKESKSETTTDEKDW